MNNKGFTLIELLAVVALLILISTIIIPIILNNSKKVKQTQYEQLVDMIESAAVEYGQENLNSLPSTKTVYELLKLGYIKGQDQSFENKSYMYGRLIDPRSNKELNNNTIDIEYYCDENAYTCEVKADFQEE